MAISPGGVVRRSDGLELAVEVLGLLRAVREPSNCIWPRMNRDHGLGGVSLAALSERLVRIQGRPRAGSRTDHPLASHLPLSKLKAGSWKRVVVTDAAGRMTRRESEFTVEVP